jgi:hypothetical protein
VIYNTYVLPRCAYILVRGLVSLTAIAFLHNNEVMSCTRTWTKEAQVCLLLLLRLSAYECREETITRVAIVATTTTTQCAATMRLFTMDGWPSQLNC